MAGTFQIRSFSPDDLTQMWQAFNLAFSDYEISFFLGFDQFVNKFIKKLKLDYSLSAGVFDDTKLVGFVFTGIGEYKGDLVAYNGGTGVIPEYRGKKLISKIYDYLLPKFRSVNIKRSVLEVITTNTKAIKAYHSLGFEKVSLLKCFKKVNNPAEEAFYSGNSFIKIKRDPEWDVFKSFIDISPSFLDSFEVLKGNIQNEKIIAYTDRSEIKGYAIYQPESGRISQLAVHKEHRRKGIGSAIVEYLNSKNVVLTAMNVNAEAKHIIDFLLKNRFINEIDQYEMQLKIS